MGCAERILVSLLFTMHFCITDVCSALYAACLELCLCALKLGFGVLWVACRNSRMTELTMREDVFSDSVRQGM